MMNTTFLQILIETFFLKENIFLINRTNLGSSIKNFHRKLKPEFCSTYGFKQLIKGQTRTTCSTSTLIDYILANTHEYISQSAMVYCTRKISRTKYNQHKQITFRSLKNYSVDVYKEALEKVSIPNYDNFDKPDLAYSDFTSRLESVINVVAPIKTATIKNNTRKWFDGEIGEEVYKRDKMQID